LSNKEVIIRDYDPVLDIHGAYRAFVSGFYHVLWPMIDEADQRLTIDMIEAICAFGNQNIVAEVDGEVIGLLAGCVGMGPASIARGIKKSAFGVFPKLLTNRYNASRKARKHMQLVFKNYGPFAMFKMPYFKPFCEVLLFTIMKEYRGRGIGRMLMDEFVRRVKAGGGNRAVVATDTTVSWWFYPAYGFKRIISVPLNDCFSISLPGEEVTGYIYSLRL